MGASSPHRHQVMLYPDVQREPEKPEMHILTRQLAVVSINQQLPADVSFAISTHLTVRVRRVLVVVPEGDEDAGDEAGHRQQNRPHGEAFEGQPDEEPVPVQAAVRPLEHPGGVEP